MVEDLKKRMGGVFQKGRELLEATAELRQEKVDLEVRLMSRLEGCRRHEKRRLTFRRRLLQPNQISFCFRSRLIRGVLRTWHSHTKTDAEK